MQHDDNFQSDCTQKSKLRSQRAPGHPISLYFVIVIVFKALFQLMSGTGWRQGGGDPPALALRLFLCSPLLYEREGVPASALNSQRRHFTSVCYVFTFYLLPPPLIYPALNLTYSLFYCPTALRSTDWKVQKLTERFPTPESFDSGMPLSSFGRSSNNQHENCFTSLVLYNSKMHCTVL